MAPPNSFDDAMKPEKFNGHHFKRWQTRMMYWLTTLDLFWVIDAPEPNPEECQPASAPAAQAYKASNFNCLGRILGMLSDQLYDIYMHYTSARALWETLEKKYSVPDAGKDLYLVEKYHDFKMTDGRPVVEQTHELQIMVGELNHSKIALPDKFQVGMVIAKLPQSWRDFATTLKHRREEMTMDDLIASLDVEEKARAKDAPSVTDDDNSRVNYTNAPQRRNKKNPKEYAHKPKGKIDKGNGKKTGKSQSGCFECGKPGHFARNCRYKKRNEKVQKDNTAAQTEAKVNMVIDEAEVARCVSNISERFGECQSTDWWVDTGATVHVCSDRSLFSSFQERRGSVKGLESKSRVLGSGRVDLKLSSRNILSLHNVLYVPTGEANLISGSLLLKSGYKLVFESNKVVITLRGSFVGKGYVERGLFRLSLMFPCLSDNNTALSVSYVSRDKFLWHNRLCHINFKSISRMMSLDLIPKHDTRGVKCEICIQAKQTRKPFKSVERDSSVLELVHSDICEMNGTLTRGGRRYFITFIDDCSKFCYVYLLRTKDEAFDHFKIYKAVVENQLDLKIKTLRSDRGGEYLANDFTKFCEEHGIIHETTAPYSPQSNGVAERKNRTLTNLINAMLSNSGLPNIMWGEALYTACFVLNRVPAKGAEVTPYELWKGRKPNLNFLKVWGCLAKVSIPLVKKRKLGPKTVDCVFLGYAKNSAAYRFLVVKSDTTEIHVNTVMESRDAAFFEDIFPMKVRASSSDPISVIPRMSNASDDSLEPRRSKRARTEKSFGDDFVIYLADDTPSTLSDAYASPEAAYWKEAVQSEMDSILCNGTWEITDLPHGCKTIGCKWIFKRKLKPDGTIDKYKARLVAKGYTQKQGEDYFDTYSPVARMPTIRALVALAAAYGYEIHQMDVKTAFLNGELEEEIYMQQPDGFVIPGQERKVCKLVKSLYGLKQAPMQWHEKFDKTLVSAGFSVNDADKCVYSRFRGNVGVILCLYVDDILILGSNVEVISDIKCFLSTKFDMKDLGPASVILNIKLTKRDNGIELNQSHYVEKLLLRFGHSNCKPAATPYDPCLKLHKNQGQGYDQVKFSQIIGSLMYLANTTRPDISYAVSRLSRYSSRPNADHWLALERVMKYLRGSATQGLFYSGFPAVLEGYSDANWITDSDEMKSTSGFVFTLGGAAVSWKSAKQTIITRSTMEAELVALEIACCEAEWLRELLMDIPIVEKPIPAVLLYCDNQAVIAKVTSKKENMKSSRHVKRRLKSVRDLRNSGVVTFDYIKTEKNLADPFTKGLARKAIQELSRGMGMRPAN